MTKGLVAIVKPVLNTFFVMIVATSVYAILGVGLFGERPSGKKYFGHFSEAFFTMFQCVSGDGWASEIARPMFESANGTCSYRNEATGKCDFDVGVAIFFVSYILVVVTVVLNVVLAVLLDEFLQATDKDQRERIRESMVDDGSARGFCHPLDPFLKYLSDFQNSDEMATRIEEAFNLFDYNNNGSVDFLEVKVGLERLKLHSKVTILEEDWRDITYHGELCGEDYTLSSEQFFEVMRNQVTLYVQRVSSKALVQEQKQKQNVNEDEQSTAFVLKYLVTAMDDLRCTIMSMKNMGEGKDKRSDEFSRIEEDVCSQAGIQPIRESERERDHLQETTVDMNAVNFAASLPAAAISQVAISKDALHPHPGI
jgi:hypothetical protein